MILSTNDRKSINLKPDEKERMDPIAKTDYSTTAYWMLEEKEEEKCARKLKIANEIRRRKKKKLH